jgi:hypothetical protein
LILIASAVIISLKRLAFISLALSLIYYLFIEKKKGSKIWILAVLIIFFYVGTNFYDFIYSRFFVTYNTLSQTGTGVIDSSTYVRISRYYLAWQTFLKNPLLGQGSGYLAFVHNGFLEILGNFGLLGLVFFKPLYKPLKEIKRYFNNPWAIALIIAMISLVALEAAINRFEIMYFIGLLYGGFLVSIKLTTNK